MSYVRTLLDPQLLFAPPGLVGLLIFFGLDRLDFTTTTRVYDVKNEFSVPSHISPCSAIIMDGRLFCQEEERPSSPLDLWPVFTLLSTTQFGVRS